MVTLAVLGCVLRATIKKVNQLFEEEKMHPQIKSWLRLCVHVVTWISKSIVAET